MAERLRIVFMGSDAVAVPLLDWLAGAGSERANLAGIVTGPDRPSGRGQELRPNPVGRWALTQAVPVLKPEKLTPDTLAWLTALKPDLSLVLAFGHILREDFIAAPRLGTLNLHASLLPKYRGASPIQAAIAQADTETGMSLMRIVRELDAGPVADQERVPILPLDTAAEVEARLAAAAVPLLARALPKLAAGTVAFSNQESAAASFCRRLSKADGELDFSAPAGALAARINALNPWPSASLAVRETVLRLGLADALEGGTGLPGEVLGSDRCGLLVATGAGTLRIRLLQRPGGRMLEAATFLRGFPVPTGTRLPSAPMAPFVASAPFRR